jgi:hypothetical protein
MNDDEVPADWEHGDLLAKANDLNGLIKSVIDNLHPKDPEYGETLENNIVKKLEELGYELIYQGGNGDFVDMLLSVDFIIKRNDKIYTAQAKTSDYQVNKFVNDYQNGKHRAVDLLIYPENAKYKIFIVKDKVTKEIDK